MHPLLPSLAAAILYAGVTGYQSLRLAQRTVPDKRLLLAVGLLALLAHGVSLFIQLLSPSGLHLDFFNASSLIAAAVILLILLALYRMPVENLLLLLFPLGCLTVLFAEFAPSGTAPAITEEPGILAHILLSILAYGMLTIAVFQALLLLLQDHHLKHKHPSGLIRNFPPLQTMESLLFGFLWAGWVVLSLSLISGWFFVEDMFAQHLVHKTMLSCIAWVVFGILLLRRPKAPRGGYTDTRDLDDVPETEGDTLVEDRPVSTLERPESARGRLTRLRGRLAKSNTMLGKGLLVLLSRERIDQDTWDEIEDTLLMADLGTDASLELVENLKKRVRVEGTKDPAQLKSLLREEMLALVDPTLDRSLRTESAPGKPAVVLVVGVNGVGKTTTVGKLARVLVAEDKDVMLGAADTFRAAAVDQLATWAERGGATIVRPQHEGQDPASVAYQTIDYAKAHGTEIVLVDTAGRLHTKGGLMDELTKIRRVIEKQAPISEVLLVLDATTGQNGMQQAKVFSEAVNVTGIVLTKLDGTAKGGIVFQVQEELGVPVKLVGLGEGADDLAPFEVESFVDALLG